MIIINLTGEHIVSVVIKGQYVNLPYSGSSARVIFEQDIVGEINGIPVYRNGTPTITGLPDPTEGVVYVVSRLVAETVRRPDVVCPNTAIGHVKKRSNGTSVSVDSFITYYQEELE